MKTTRIQLIDAGTGNLQSVYNALNHLGAEIKVVSDTNSFRGDIKTVLPGVGAFRQFMDGLIRRDLLESILEIAKSKIPLLGICVGMQALFDSSEEMGDTPGLGIIPGLVRRFPEEKEWKIPQTGWNEIIVTHSSPLFKRIDSGAFFYFNHSYYCQPSCEEHWQARTEYILPFASAVSKDTVFGVQFHPEKSQKLGLRLLQNFLEL